MTMPTDELSPAAQAAVERAQLLYPGDPDLARDVLEPYAAEGGVSELLANMAQLADPADGEGGASSEAELVAKLDGIREHLAKADEFELPAATRDHLVKAERSLERELLGKHNPAAAAEWDRTWGQVHAVA
jgi:hypothetical protein